MLFNRYDFGRKKWKWQKPSMDMNSCVKSYLENVFITFTYSANTRIKHILYLYPATLHWIRQHTVLLPQFLFLKKKKNRGKEKKIKAKRENFGFFFLSSTRGWRYNTENNESSCTSLYGLGGLIGRDADNQDWAGPRWERSSRGYRLESPHPQGSFFFSPTLFLLLFFGPMGLSRSPGSKSVEHESLQGPYRQ